MQWTSGENAGFSSAESTWLPVSSDHARRNVETQDADPTSMLSLYRQLTDLRSTSTALKYGDMEIIEHLPETVLGYIRRSKADDPGDDKNDYVILINFSDRIATCLLNVPLGKLMVSSDPEFSPAVATGTEAEYELRPYQAVVYALDRPQQ